MGRPAKKRKYAEAKATRKGELQAEYDFKKAHSITKKPMDFLEEHIEKQIDKTDWIEFSAVVGMTFLVHQIVIKNFMEFVNEITTVTELPQRLFKVTPEIGNIFGISKADVMSGLPIPKGVMEWIVSFAMAYIIIKHGGQLVGLLDKGLVAVVPMLLGVV